jgi:hypothetical protein
MGEQAGPRWFGAQGAESGHEARISPSPHLRRVKDEPSKIAITACQKLQQDHSSNV